MKLRTRVIFLLISLGLSACGGGGGSNSSCDEPLTTSYIHNTITAFPGFSESNTTIVYVDGDQGNTYDINQIAVSRISYQMQDSLAFSYTVYGTAEPPAGTHGAFYLDTDKNDATGMTILPGSFGADALVVNAPGGAANGFYLWNSGTNSWIRQPLLGTLGSNASYFQGCHYSTTVYAPLYAGLSDLYTQDIRGILLVVTIADSDPTNVTGILDATLPFDFTVP